MDANTSQRQRDQLPAWSCGLPLVDSPRSPSGQRSRPVGDDHRRGRPVRKQRGAATHRGRCKPAGDPLNLGRALEGDLQPRRQVQDPHASSRYRQWRSRIDAELRQQDPETDEPGRSRCDDEYVRVPIGGDHRARQERGHGGDDRGFGEGLPGKRFGTSLDGDHLRRNLRHERAASRMALPHRWRGPSSQQGHRSGEPAHMGEGQQRDLRLVLRSGRRNATDCNSRGNERLLLDRDESRSSGRPHGRVRRHGSRQ